jgi:hypothetical protein
MSKRKTTAPAPTKTRKSNADVETQQDAAENRKFIIIMVVATAALMGLLFLLS